LIFTHSHFLQAHFFILHELWSLLTAQQVSFLKGHEEHPLTINITPSKTLATIIFTALFTITSYLFVLITCKNYTLLVKLNV